MIDLQGSLSRLQVVQARGLTVDVHPTDGDEFGLDVVLTRPSDGQKRSFRVRKPVGTEDEHEMLANAAIHAAALADELAQ